MAFLNKIMSYYLQLSFKLSIIYWRVVRISIWTNKRKTLERQNNIQQNIKLSKYLSKISKTFVCNSWARFNRNIELENVNAMDRTETENIKSKSPSI